MITSPPITVQHLEALLSRYATPRGSTALARAGGFAMPLSRYNLAWAARQHKLLPTLASAWQASGVDVEDALLAEVEAHRRRAEHYARLLAQLTDLAGPGIRPFKGAVVAALYPHGWVRRSGDLDIEVSSLEEALIVGRYLQDSGWTVIRLSLFQADGSPRIALNLVDLRSGGALLDYDRVHLQGFAFRGDVWGLPPRVTYDGSDDHTPRSRTMLTLVEPFQRRTIARDVLDFALLAPALADTERVGLHRAMATLDLWPEWNRLRSAVVDAEMLVSEAVAAANATQERAARWRRTVATRRRRARVLLTRGGTARDAALYAAGYPVSGTPDPQERSAKFTVQVDRRSGVTFRGPLGAGRLRFHATI